MTFLPILYGLFSAFSYGAGDFNGGMLSRRTGAVRAVLYAYSLGTLLLAIVAIASGESFIAWRDWLWCSGAGLVGATGLLLLYHALSKGQMSIVAPVSALAAAALPVITGIFLEGVPKLTTLLGFVLALAAIWLISRPGNETRSLRLRFTDLRLPLLSGVCFGLYFILIHQGSREAFFWPITSARFAGSLVLLIFAGLTRQVRPPERAVWHLLLLNTIFDTGGNAFYLLAAQAGRMDMAAVLSSLYPGSTVLLARLILKERLSRLQLVGILIALGAIVLMTI